MAATAPPVITALPTPPDPNDRSTFNARAYPWSVAQQTLANEVGAVAANVFSNATEATEAAARAVPAAAAAEAASNAAPWVSGATYLAGAVVWSPINALSYRRKSAGAGTTDPSADSANWAALAGGTPSLARSARTSNTQLVAADSGKWIDATSGTFTQTFAAVATLGDGWYCYLRNSGTGDITLDPNSTELIDGLTSYVMYPGEVRLVQCDGVALRSIVLNAFSKTFTASGSFYKPPGYQRFEGLLWGAGGGGAKASDFVFGGAGGGCAPIVFSSAALSTTETVTLGAGGTASTTNSGNAGGNSSFKGITAYGGYGGRTNPALVSGGAAFFSDLTVIVSSVLGGAVGHSTGEAFYGGAVCSTEANDKRTVYGGGHGGFVSSSAIATPRVSTIYGGEGGPANSAENGADGTAPGGGGGCTRTGTQSGAGARGELRIWGII